MNKVTLLDYLNIVNLKLNNVLSIIRSDGYTDNLVEVTSLTLQVDDTLESIIKSLHYTVMQLENMD